MKKTLYISGIFTALLLTLLLSGWANKDDTIKESLRQGNRQFESFKYQEALKFYETGLAESLEHKALNFNAAQAAYILGEYQKAAEYYEKSEDSREKFLNAGNIFFRAGDVVEEDINQKAQFYAQAMQLYKEGIIKYPQDIPLKYNYELVKEKLEELLQDTEQEKNGEGEDGESQENQENKENQDTNGESEQGEQDSEDSEDSEDEQESQGQNSEQDENSDDEQNQQAQDEQDEQQENDEEQEGYSQDESETSPDQEAIERILQMLESQEQESLKNNQEVVGGNEGKNDW